MDAEKRAVIDRLEYYDRQFGGILDLLASEKVLPLQGAKKAHAQALLRILKEKLKNEFRDLYNRRGELNRWEKDCLQPAVNEAHANTMTKYNTNPDGKWAADLAGARVSITHVLSQLSA